MLGVVSIQSHLILTAILLERYDFADNKLKLRGSAELGHKTSKWRLGFELGLCDWKARPSPPGDLQWWHGGGAHSVADQHISLQKALGPWHRVVGREVVPGGGTLPS